jgi:hypothetical protein
VEKEQSKKEKRTSEEAKKQEKNKETGIEISKKLYKRKRKYKGSIYIYNSLNE